MTRTERQVLHMICSRERSPDYEGTMGVTVSTPTGKSLEAQGMIVTKRYGKRYLRAWSTANGRREIDG